MPGQAKNKARATGEPRGMEVVREHAAALRVASGRRAPR
jgi:hypothetical protein